MLSYIITHVKTVMTSIISTFLNTIVEKVVNSFCVNPVLRCQNHYDGPDFTS